MLSLALSLPGPLVDPAAGQMSAGQRAELLSPAEFPDYDARDWRKQRDGLATKAATNKSRTHEGCGPVASSETEN